MLLRAAARRVVFYDLETSIVARARAGSPRPRAAGRRNLIVEIGAVCDQGHTFHRLVDPRRHGMSLQDTFAQTGQNPERTLRFWQKLFAEKELLPRRGRRGGGRRASAAANLEARCARMEELFDGDAFVTTRTALTQFTQFVFRADAPAAPPLLVAHNGASFDHSIVRAHQQRLALPTFDPATLKDSLRPARQLLPHFKSHTLSNLHKHLVREPFQAHHALSDALALFRVCQALAVRERVPLDQLWTAQRLTSLRGVGPKTARALRNAGYTYAGLKQAVRSHAECPPALRACLRNHKALWRQLRGTWAVADAVTTPRRTPRRGSRQGSRPRAPRRRARRAKSV